MERNGISNLFRLLGIRNNASQEEVEQRCNKKIKELESKEVLTDFEIELLDSLRREYTLMEINGFDEYRRAKGIHFWDGKDIDWDLFYNESENIPKRENKNQFSKSKKYKSSKEKKIVIAKGNLKDKFKNKFLIVILTGSLLISTPFVAKKIQEKINAKNITPSVGMEDELDFETIDKEKINYIVESGDTKSELIEELELDDKEASKLPRNLYIGEEYNLYVPTEIANEYNKEQEEKNEKEYLCTITLLPGDDLLSVAESVKKEYPEQFKNLRPIQIARKIAHDNGYYSADEYQPGDYTIYAPHPSDIYDEVVSFGYNK